MSYPDDTPRKNPLSGTTRNAPVSTLRARLLHHGRELSEAGAIALKGGTEAEQQSIESCVQMFLLTGGILPLHVKVGGQEPLNDLQTLLSFGVSRVVFPMVESVFAVEKATQALKKICGEEVLFTSFLNLESIGAWQTRDAILDRATSLGFAGINVGRSDLSASFGGRPDSTVTTEMVVDIVSGARERGLSTGVGGSIRTDNIEALLSATEVDTFETRNVLVSTERVTDPVETVRAALAFEADLNRLESLVSRRTAHTHDERVIEILRRLSGSTRVLRG